MIGIDRIARVGSHQYAPSGPVVVRSTATQAFQGLPIGRENRIPPCIECGERLAVGAAVEVYVYRPIGRLAWSVGHVRCEDCWMGSIHVTTLGVREILLRSHIGEMIDEVGDERWSPCLAGIEAVAVSPPDQAEDSNLP